MKDPEDKEDSVSIIERPDEEDLVEKVRKSMCKNLKRKVTEQEARQHIQICHAVDKANYSSSSVMTKKRATSSKLFSLDELASDNNAKRNLRDWCLWWDNINDGRIMASSADLYHGFKEFKQAFDGKNERKARRAEDARANIRSDLENGGIIAATRFEFEIPKGKHINHPRPGVTLTHHYNCKYMRELKVVRSLLPFYEGMPKLTEVCNKAGGLDLLQALFFTQDSAEEMAKNLGFISGKNVDDVRFMVPNAKNRKANPHRSTRLFIHNNYFCILSSILSSEGFSRGYCP